jgi:hypothetical protein
MRDRRPVALAVQVPIIKFDDSGIRFSLFAHHRLSPTFIAAVIAAPAAK